LIHALQAEGHVVRGTTRRAAGLEPIEREGAEGVLADPDRLATLMPHLQGVSVLAWLMGSASGEPEAVAALHGPRLRSLIEALVDTPVRGLVYEAAGSVSPALLGQGAEIVREGAETWRMPVQVIEQDPADGSAWVTEMSAAVAAVLAA